MNNNLLVYKASAGSGKTYTLSAEYIARLLCGTPDTYRHILAVTFTNKATAEMKERILQYLWELGYTDTDFKEKIQEIAPHLTDEQIRTSPPLSDLFSIDIV
jgi:ATP-dependent exoDNAse (exonuclease V) beta subunit